MCLTGVFPAWNAAEVQGNKFPGCIPLLFCFILFYKCLDPAPGKYLGSSCIGAALIVWQVAGWCHFIHFLVLITSFPCRGGSHQSSIRYFPCILITFGCTTEKPEPGQAAWLITNQFEQFYEGLGEKYSMREKSSACVLQLIDAGRGGLSF